jgi:hypothetical protein
MLLYSYLGALSCIIGNVLAIWPQPMIFEHGSKVLWLSPNFETHYEFEEPLGRFWETALPRPK